MFICLSYNSNIMNYNINDDLYSNVNNFNHSKIWVGLIKHKITV